MLSLLIFGGATLQDFAFAMLIGIASGTYSSIFIASPVLTAWKEREPGFIRRRQRIAEVEGGLVPAYADDVQVARLAADDETEGETDRAGDAERAPAPRRKRGGGAVATAEPAQIEAAPSGGRRRSRRRPEAPPPPKRRRRRRPTPTPIRSRRSGANATRNAGPNAPSGAKAANGDERGSGLMAFLVWLTMGIALWHFTVFLPDRFWQGIVGAFVGAVIGAIVVGTDRRC